MSGCCGVHGDKKGHAHGHAHAPAGGSGAGVVSAAATAIDPVCGMTVSIAGARHTLAYQGRTFYFCCAPCRETFAREPARYAAVTT